MLPKPKTPLSFNTDSGLHHQKKNKFFRKNKKASWQYNVGKIHFKNVYIKSPFSIFRNFLNTEPKRFSHASSLLSVCSSQMDKRENVAQLSLNTTLFAYTFTLHAKIWGIWFSSSLDMKNKTHPHHSLRTLHQWPPRGQFKHLHRFTRLLKISPKFV